MKKFLYIPLVCLMLLTVLLTGAAIAEGVDAEPVAAINWTEVASYLLYAVVAAIGTIITKYIVPWLKAIKDAKMAKIENDKLRAGLDAAMDAVLTAVAYTNQTYVEALKDKNIFDETAQRQAFRLSWDTANKLLTQAAKNALVALYGGVDDWLTAKIEQTTNDLKKGLPLLGLDATVTVDE